MKLALLTKLFFFILGTKKSNALSKHQEKTLKAIGITSTSQKEASEHITAEAKALNQETNEALAKKKQEKRACKHEAKELKKGLKATDEEKDAEQEIGYKKEQVAAKSAAQLEKKEVTAKIAIITSEIKSLKTKILVQKETKFWPSKKEMVDEPVTFIVLLAVFLYCEYWLSKGILELIGAPDAVIAPIAVIISTTVGLFIHFGSKALAKEQWFLGSVLSLLGLGIVLIMTFYVRAPQEPPVKDTIPNQPSQLFHTVAETSDLSITDQEAEYRLNIVYSTLYLSLFLLAFAVSYFRARREGCFQLQDELATKSGELVMAENRNSELDKIIELKDELDQNEIKIRVKNADNEAKLRLKKLEIKNLTLSADIDALNMSKKSIKGQVKHFIELGWRKSPYNT